MLSCRAWRLIKIVHLMILSFEPASIAIHLCRRHLLFCLTCSVMRPGDGSVRRSTQGQDARARNRQRGVRAVRDRMETVMLE
jgi:hypothetical protein